MMKFTMSPTDEYERLVKFFVENHLEFDGDEEVDTDIVKCWKVTHKDDVLIGACVLAKRQGKYIIDGIAVTKLFRKFGIGKIMVDRVVKEIKSLGGHELYLVLPVSSHLWDLRKLNRRMRRFSLNVPSVLSTRKTVTRRL